MFTVLGLEVLISCKPFVIEGGIGTGEVLSTESDADTDLGLEQESADSDTEADADSGSDTDTVGDTGADADTGTDADTEADADTGGDADTEQDTDTKTTDGVEVLVEITSDWDTGFCTNVAVTNNGTSTVMWETTYDVGGSITSLWNAESTAVDPLTRFVGAQWNDTLQPGSATSFGYCANR